MTEPIRVPNQAWRKSSYSGSNGGECVEIAIGIPGTVPVRDSKDPMRPRPRHLPHRVGRLRRVRRRMGGSR